MATITADHIASVSLKDADRNPDEFAQKLGRSFEEYGFAIIADHGIPDELIHRAEQKAKDFFALPEEVKKSYLIAGGGGARGYTPFGIETAKGAKAHDLKEFWHVGRDLPEGHKFRAHMPDNVWPEEVPGFRDTFEELVRAFDAPASRSCARSRATSASTRIISSTRCATAIRCCACCTIRRSRASRAATSAPARTRTSTPSRCCSAPRKRGSSC